jgi:hypothetical protein
VKALERQAHRRPFIRGDFIQTIDRLHEVAVNKETEEVRNRNASFHALFLRIGYSKQVQRGAPGARLKVGLHCRQFGRLGGR